MTDDHLLIRTTGQKHTGAQESVDALYKEIYAPFAKWSHVPYHIVAYEVEEGWEMMGLATLYWTLAVPGMWIVFSLQFESGSTPGMLPQAWSTDL